MTVHTDAFSPAGRGFMSIRDRPISLSPPWQIGPMERLIGTIRHECLDRVLIIGIRHLRRPLASYAADYDQTRTYLARQKDALRFCS